jgi:hypothetical protein
LTPFFSNDAANQSLTFSTIYILIDVEGMPATRLDAGDQPAREQP